MILNRPIIILEIFESLKSSIIIKPISQDIIFVFKINADFSKYIKSLIDKSLISNLIKLVRFINLFLFDYFKLIVV